MPKCRTVKRRIFAILLVVNFIYWCQFHQRFRCMFFAQSAWRSFSLVMFWLWQCLKLQLNLVKYKIQGLRKQALNKRDLGLLQIKGQVPQKDTFSITKSQKKDCIKQGPPEYVNITNLFIMIDHCPDKGLNININIK